MMTFVFAGEDKIIIDHTEVNPRNEGKGFGKTSYFSCEDWLS